MARAATQTATVEHLLDKGEVIMRKTYSRLMLMTFIVIGLATSVFAQNSNDEARKHLVRGMAAIEMAKSEADLAAAASEFRKATVLAPTMAAAWYNLGSVQSKMGQIKDAIASYRRYLSLAPKADDARLVNDEIIKLEYRLERAEANVLKKDGRFIAYVNGTVLDTRTNLMWAAKDNGVGINWQNAKTYCENYNGGGYADWRMPKQAELAGLIDAGKTYQAECRGPFGGTYDIHSIEFIRLTCVWVWASETRGDWAAIVQFSDGTGRNTPQEADGPTRALPVRPAK